MSDMNKGPRVEVVDLGEPQRSALEIFLAPPKLDLKPVEKREGVVTLTPKSLPKSP